MNKEQLLRNVTSSDPELLKEIDHIPDPPPELNEKGATYYWKICDHLIRTDSLSKAKCLIASNLAYTAIQMQDDPFYFEPVELNQSDTVRATHRLAEIQIQSNAAAKVAYCIGLTLEDLEQMGVPIQSALAKQRQGRGYE